MASIYMPFVSKYDRTAIWPDDLALPPGTKNGERRLEFQTRGPWQIIQRLSGLAVAKDEGGVRVYGDRSLLSPRESGYQMEGYVSVDGKRRSAFTSSQMFLHKGKLVNMAILYVRDR